MTLASFIVLIIGSNFNFKCFPHLGDLDKCVIYHHSFLLVPEGLSKIVIEAKREGSLKGINIGNFVNLTHLLFLDDVLLFGKGSLKEAKNTKKF